jgi:Phospholipase_D-nuclease N-terminal
MTGHQARRRIAPGRAGGPAVLAALSLTACGGISAGEVSLAEGLGAMAIFFVGAAVIWIFIALFADIFRRPDLSGGVKAGWVLLLVVLPLVGSLIYITVRPKVTEADRVMTAKPTDLTDAQMVAELNRLKAAGKISDADYEEEMRHVRS